LANLPEEADIGSKGGTTQQTSSSSGPPPQVTAAYQGLIDRATNVANQPYQPYQGELVAPLTTQTNQGLGGISAYANAAQPYLGAAGAMTMGASAPVNPSQFMGMGSLAPFMNPYTSSVVDTTQAEMNNQNQQQAQFLNSANISSGAFGGDRAGIGQSILANQQQLAEAPTIAGLNQANFTQAMSDWTGQQGVNLAAQQANRSAQLAGGAQLGQIGLSAQEAGLQGSQADIQAGMIPQQEQQAIDTAAQQMYQQGQAYPFTTTGWLGNIIEGVGGQSGGTSQTTSPGPNSITQGLGAASQGMGLLTSLMSLSDERAKENVEQIGKTYDGQNIYRYNFRGDPRTQIGLLAQEEAYHHPGSVQRVGMGDLLGIDYRSATDDAAERGHYADGGAPDQGPPEGGMTQGVTQGAGQPPPKPQEMNPDQALMWMGDPGARVGMGSFGLMGGTSMHPQPEMPIAGPQGASPPQVPLGGGGAGLSPLGAPLEPIFPSQSQGEGSGGAWRGGRQGFQGGGQAAVGPNAAMGMATPGFDPGVDPLNPLAGVNEALFGEETAGSKNPYTGIDFDQAMAIGGGQWMPPQTGATMPDFSNLQNSPEFGAAESSLSGLFGPGYTPGSTTLGAGGAGPTAPAANAPGGSGPMNAPTMGGIVGGARSPGAMGAAGATQGGLSRGQLSDIFSQYFGGESPAQAAPPQGPLPGHARGGRIGRQTGGATATLALPINQGPWGVQSGGTQPAANSGMGMGGLGGSAGGPWTQMMGAPSAMNPSGNAQVGMANWAGFSGPQGMMEADAEGFRADGGGVDMNGRSGFQRGGSPFTTYQPTANPARNPPTYTALDLSRLFGGGSQPQAPQAQAQVPSAIAMTRQLQAQARAKAAAARGMTQPTHIVRTVAPDPATGELHDMHRPVSIPMKQPYDRPPVGTGPAGNDREGGAPAPAHNWGPWHAGGTPSGPIIADPTQSSGSPSILPHLWGGGGDQPIMPYLRGPPAAKPPMVNFGTLDDAEKAKEAAAAAQQAPLPMTPEDMANQSGRLGQRTGGRIGRQDGGASSNMPYPGQVDPSGTWAPPAASALSDEDFARGLQGEMQQAHDADAGSLGWVDQANKGLEGWPSGLDALQHPAQRARIDPRAVAEAPSFQGAGGGGGGPHFTQTSLMGGPPISALDLSGHYTPTSGNARGATYVPGSPGAGISPNARAQAPEHPAITTMRHIVRAHDAARARPVMSKVDPNIGPFLSDKIDTSYGPQQPPAAYGHSSVSPNFQGGGGVLGSSPVMNAGGYTPQGEGLTGRTSQGEGLGSIALAKTGSGFGDLFGGGGRAGFASGGLSSTADPFLSEITASIPSAGGGGGGGHGPPAPPPPAPQPPAGQDPTKGLGDSLGKLGTAVKKFTGQSGGQQTTPSDLTPAAAQNLPNFTPADTSAMDAVSSGSVFDGLQDSDLGFKTGGGVGLGSLRGRFSDGGSPDQAAPAAPADDPAWNQAFLADIKGAPGGSGTTAAPATGGGGVPDLIKQNFGERAGYASTISRLESGYGANYVGDDNSSFGPFQLHIGGISQKYPHPGLGDTFREQTGLDPRDPKTVPQQVAFVSDYTAKHGWNDWSTKAQADKIAGGGAANVPAQDVQPAEADTTSYGGGFQLPGPTPSGPPPGQLDRSNLQAPTMGDELKHDPGGYMMSVGAAMMASRSPWLGVGIGEGLVAGNNYLQAQKGLEKQWGEAQAQINNLSQEARDKGADADLKAQQLQFGAIGMKMKIAWLRAHGMPIDGSGSASPGATGGPGQPPLGLQPTQPLGGGTAPSGAPSGPSAPSGAAPTSGVPDVSSDPRWKTANDLITEGENDNASGAMFGFPGAGNAKIKQGQALMDAVNKDWEAKKAPIVAGETATRQKVSDAYATEADESGDRISLLQKQEQSLKAMQAIMQKGYLTGAWADNAANIEKTFRQFGINIGQPASWEEFNKYSKGDQWDSLKEQKGAVRNKEMDAAAAMNPNPTWEPETNAAILGKQLGTVKREEKMMRDYSADLDAGRIGPNTNIHPGDWARRWAQKKENALQPFVDKEVKNFAYAGQKGDIYSGKDLEEGQVYISPKDGKPHRWIVKPNGKLGWDPKPFTGED
jgi:hypothetical protein